MIDFIVVLEPIENIRKDTIYTLKRQNERKRASMEA